MRDVRPVMDQRLQDIMFWMIFLFSLQLFLLGYKCEFSQIDLKPGAVGTASFKDTAHFSSGFNTGPTTWIFVFMAFVPSSAIYKTKDNLPHPAQLRRLQG